ncbi:MAG TPA: hypothetical protein DD433_01450 [Ruminococcaceae bacterium]|nr:hypothetical protein [Oscillospiraceae bacterium]
MDMFSIISARRYIRQGGGLEKGREGFSPYLFINLGKDIFPLANENRSCAVKNGLADALQCCPAVLF